MSETNSFNYYNYDPSIGAAVTFCSLFALTSIVHAFQLIRYRTWYFIPFLIGGICESIGYIGRIISATETPNWTLGPYLMQTLLILIAPSLFAASTYMILGRLIRLVDGDARSIIKPSWLTKIFVTADVISFIMQGAGGGMMAAASDQAGFNLGQNVIIGGLFAQIFAFSVFIICTSIFHWRIVRAPTDVSQTTNIPWRRYLLVLYGVSGLIFVRCLFRVIEYLQGSSGSIQKSEALTYIFDATLMFITMILLNVFHPCKIVSEADDRLSGQKEDTSTYSTTI